MIVSRDDDLRQRVATASQVLAMEDHGDLVWGHVSVRDPQGRGVWMKAATWGFEEVTPARVLLVGWGGEVLAGEGRRHAEWPIHTEIMRSRPDVHSVVHTHAPHAVAFAALAQPLRPISHEGTLFVPPDIARFAKTGDLILTRDLGQALAAALGGRNAALMVHHGIVTAGADVESAVVGAILLERACRKQLLAMAAGALQSWSSDEEALAKRAHCYAPDLIRQAWAYLVRRVAARGTAS
ncbi:MAG: class II aldolase/adducin family protein [Armatimonadota bacterium]|nr:class II aldolase/adducin family protein [Armatimonadota bacterium]MDR7519759.1 class II aldolase/adducin family protein [Armatimonadota bacterium]MDR7549972.1 class II aldolase/adducin family protein [Armatimonadota bacterium]